MIDKSFVEAIQDNYKTDVVMVDGMEFASKPVFNPPLPHEPLAAALVVSTLTGLVDYWRGFIAPGPEHVIHVASYHVVNLLTAIKGAKREREQFIQANCGSSPFKFGQFMPHSEFMIAIQAMFADYGDRSKVMRILGTVKDEAARISNDDGVTQKVTASTGIALSQEVALPNPVMLKPFRTFLEVEQPPSLFVLRVNSVPNQLPQIALFEADGGQWKREAILAIREYLAEKINGTPIIA